MSTVFQPGQRFGRLVLVDIDLQAKSRNKKWICRCDCGNEKSILADTLRAGKAKSCGCLRTEQLVRRYTLHGLSKTRLHAVWRSMTQRCSNPQNKGYKNYGGRGIYVCQEWHDFAAFFDWAISSGYKNGLSIERVNNDGPYSPQNCKWATRTVQARNTRRNLVAPNGQLWADVANENGIPGSTFRSRIYIGWEISRAATETRRPRHV